MSNDLKRSSPSLGRDDDDFELVKAMFNAGQPDRLTHLLGPRFRIIANSIIFKRGLVGIVDRQDLISEAWIDFCTSYQKKPIPPELALSNLTMRGHVRMMDYLRDSYGQGIYTPGTVRRRQHDLRAIEIQIDPTSPIAEKVRVAKEKLGLDYHSVIRRAFELSSSSASASFDRPGRDPIQRLNPCDDIPDSDLAPPDLLEQAQHMLFLRTAVALARLNDREQCVMYHLIHGHEGIRLADIAEYYSVSPSRISQVVNIAQEKVRKAYNRLDTDSDDMLYGERCKQEQLLDQWPSDSMDEIMVMPESYRSLLEQYDRMQYTLHGYSLDPVPIYTLKRHFREFNIQAQQTETFIQTVGNGGQIVGLLLNRPVATLLANHIDLDFEERPYNHFHALHKKEDKPFFACKARASVYYVPTQCFGDMKLSDVFKIIEDHTEPPKTSHDPFDAMVVDFEEPDFEYAPT